MELYDFTRGSYSKPNVYYSGGLYSKEGKVETFAVSKTDSDKRYMGDVKDYCLRTVFTNKTAKDRVMTNELLRNMMK